VTWAELIRRLKAHGFEELRTGKGSHRQFWHLVMGKILTVTVHTKKEVKTSLANRILKDTNIKDSKG